MVSDSGTCVWFHRAWTWKLPEACLYCICTGIVIIVDYVLCGSYLAATGTCFGVFGYKLLCCGICGKLLYALLGA